MEFPEYLSLVQARFGNSIKATKINANIFFEERFELKWLATQLKQFSFVSFSDRIDAQTIREYNEKCFDYALSNATGLPRGFQAGIGCYCVIAGHVIMPDAIEYANAKPKKHFAAFELTIVVDLDKEEIYFCRKTPMWGAIYYKHFRTYITQNFSVKK
jgi:hypothetical protein